MFQSISGRLPKRGRKRRERIDESKNVQTTLTRTYCKRSRPLLYCNPNCRTSSAGASYTDNGKLITRLYGKRDDFNFPVVSFPFLNSNIPSAPAYGVYVSQLVRYAGAGCKYQDLDDRRKLLTNKLFSQGYQKAKLVSAVKSSLGDIMTSLIPTMWPFLNLFQI